MMYPNDEGSRFPKFHFHCNKEERLVLDPFFRDYNLFHKSIQLLKEVHHSVSCYLNLHISKGDMEYPIFSVDIW